MPELCRAHEAGRVRDRAGAQGDGVKRELCVQAESASFLDRIFRGAANPLLVHFARNARLTEEEARDLKKLLDQSIQGTSPRK